MANERHRRFFARPECVQGNIIYIRDKELHYLKDVLRLKKGAAITIFDGGQKEYTGIIADITDKEAIVDIRSSGVVLSNNAACKIILAQAISKLVKIDFIVEKATELGVDEIMPVSAERAIVKLNNQKLQDRQKRWQRIAQAASRQCGRPDVPVIRECMDVKDALAVLKNCQMRLFFCIHKQAVKLQEILKNTCPPKSIAVFIGPEGDFTEREAGLARENGFNPASLGGRTLRSETAGLCALSILNYLYRQ